MTVFGRVGTAPTIEIRVPPKLDGFETRMLKGGSGHEVTEDSLVPVSVTVFDGTSGRVLSESDHFQISLDIVGSGQINDNLSYLVVGRHEGTHVLALRSIMMGDRSPSTIEVGVVDILPSIATGISADANVDPMSVEVSPGGPIIGRTDMLPGDVTTQTLIKGDGVQAHEGDRVITQFTVLSWTDNTVCMSTWETGVPEVVSLGMAMKGLATTLVDQKVGLQLTITTPLGLITDDDALCAVIGILGTEPGTTANGD